MFFHLDSSLQKTVHEWAGWLMVLAVVTHATANWLGFKRHLQLAGKCTAILAASALALVGILVLAPAGGAGRLSPPAIAMRAMAQAR